MSKLSAEAVQEAVIAILANAQQKKRKFVESVELQIALKNYDPQKDKRFTGTVVLPYITKSKFRVCIIGDAKHSLEAQKLGMDTRTEDDLAKLKKNKKLVKQLANSYDAFLASASLVRKIPRLLGPGLNKAGKFPATLGPNDDIEAKAKQQQASVKFQLKSKKTLCLGCAIGNVTQTAEEIQVNTITAINFFVSLLPKHWQQVKRMYMKSTMGPVHQIFGF